MSAVGLVMAPVFILLAGTRYQNTLITQQISFGVEDFLFTFSLFGIASIIYHVLLGKHVHSFKGDKLRLKNPAAHWIAHLVLVLGTWICLTLSVIVIFSTPPMQAILFGGALIGIYMIANRHDLLVDALLSGIMSTALVFLVEQLFFIRLSPEIASAYWQWSDLSPFILGGIPLEELFWAAIVGFTIGPMYEWLRHKKISP